MPGGSLELGIARSGNRPPVIQASVRPVDETRSAFLQRKVYQGKAAARVDRARHSLPGRVIDSRQPRIGEQTGRVRRSPAACSAQTTPRFAPSRRAGGPGSTNPCPSLGYTTSSVGTCWSRSACQNSNDCGAGHSPSRSPTTTRVGVLRLLDEVDGRSSSRRPPDRRRPMRRSTESSTGRSSFRRSSSASRRCRRPPPRP